MTRRSEGRIQGMRTFVAGNRGNRMAGNTRESAPAPSFLRICAGLLLGILVGCAARSQLYDMWVDPAAASAPLENLLVIAMAREEPARRLWEDEFVARLGEHDTRAIPSYRLFPSEIPDTSQIAAAVAREGFDGVLIINRLPGQTETRYVPGYVSTEPVTRYSYWRRRYVTRYREVLHPSYVETSQIVRRQVEVCSARRGGELLWTGTTETVDPTSPEMVRKEAAALIVPELSRHGVISG